MLTNKNKNLIRFFIIVITLIFAITINYKLMILATFFLSHAEYYFLYKENKITKFNKLFIIVSDIIFIPIIIYILFY